MLQYTTKYRKPTGVVHCQDMKSTLEIILNQSTELQEEVDFIDDYTFKNQRYVTLHGE